MALPEEALSWKEWYDTKGATLQEQLRVKSFIVHALRGLVKYAPKLKAWTLWYNEAWQPFTIETSLLVEHEEHVVALLQARVNFIKMECGNIAGQQMRPVEKLLQSRADLRRAIKDAAADLTVIEDVVEDTATNKGAPHDPQERAKELRRGLTDPKAAAQLFFDHFMQFTNDTSDFASNEDILTMYTTAAEMYTWPTLNAQQLAEYFKKWNEARPVDQRFVTNLKSKGARGIKCCALGLQPDGPVAFAVQQIADLERALDEERASKRARITELEERIADLERALEEERASKRARIEELEQGNNAPVEALNGRDGELQQENQAPTATLGPNDFEDDEDLFADVPFEL